MSYADQRVYRHRSGEAPQPLTPEDRRRYADIVVDAARNRLLAVCEDHRAEGEPVNSLVAIDLAGGKVYPLAEGADFYSTPRLSPDGRCLAWLAWHHPNMPWDGSELWLATVRDDGTLDDPRLVAGGPKESVFQPEFGPDGTLYFVSDRSNWWNLYRVDEPGIVALAPREAEFGMPQWVFGMSTYGFASRHEIVCAFNRTGAGGAAFSTRIRVASCPSRRHTPRSALCAPPPVAPCSSVPPPASCPRWSRSISRRAAARCCGTRARAGGPGLPLRTRDARFRDGTGRDGIRFFYPPRNHDFAVPPGERPPPLVFAHGGPTAAASPALNLKIQYWTSRGFAVLDVNYRGSTGYGRAYREKLNGQWGGRGRRGLRGRRAVFDRARPAGPSTRRDPRRQRRRLHRPLREHRTVPDRPGHAQTLQNVPVPGWTSTRSVFQ